MAESNYRLRVIEAELVQLRQKVPEIEDTKLIAAVIDLVKVEIRKSQYKHLNINFLFPPEYPHSPVVMEFNSKTLAYKLLQGLGKVCENEAQQLLGQRQIVYMIEFVKKFIEENPLCVCSEEIAFIRKELLTADDEIKLKQKTSQIKFKIHQENYYMNLTITIPENYPLAPVMIEVDDHNFPKLLKVTFQAQAVELARQCVQPPLKKKPKDPPFVPQPSLYPVCKYLIKDCVKHYPQESCPLCKQSILPSEPSVITNMEDSIERVYCGHLFHFQCLDKYMKTPPFADSKFCNSCGKQIFHDKWKISAEVMEQRWAHHQAKQRELDEVVDFLG